MDKIKQKLLAAAEENGWDIELSRKISGWLITVPDGETEAAIRDWAKGNDAHGFLYYRWKIQPPTPEDLGLGGNHIPYEGSDERGVGTGNE